MVPELQQRLALITSEKKVILSDSKRKIIDLDKARKRQKDLIDARTVITDVQENLQLSFKDNVENLVTSTIRSVFTDRDFTFLLDFKTTKSRGVQCTPLIKEGDFEFEPKDEMGGSIIDLISFAFRVVLWSLETPRTRNTFILDEPMKWLGKEKSMELAGRMFHELSLRLNLQLIIVTHEEKLAQIADRVWVVEIEDGISTVTLQEAA